MSELIVPPTLAGLLTAFTPWFQARSVLTFQWLVLGWIECQGRRTITMVVLASGALGQRHIAVFHRFFSRASWSLDALGHQVFALALAWVPTDRPLVVLGDDTLALPVKLTVNQNVGTLGSRCRIPAWVKTDRRKIRSNQQDDFEKHRGSEDAAWRHLRLSTTPTHRRMTDSI